jgi:hypothetical protein
MTADAICQTCGAEQFSKGARFCTKCSQALPARHATPDDERRQGRARRFLRALLTSSSLVGVVLAPRAERRASVKYAGEADAGSCARPRPMALRRVVHVPKYFECQASQRRRRRCTSTFRMCPTRTAMRSPSCGRSRQERTCLRRPSVMRKWARTLLTLV